jgi:hypothetical protein
MKARNTVITMALVSTPLALLSAAEAKDAGNEAKSSLSAGLFCENNLVPGPAIFLRDSTHAQMGVTPLALINGFAGKDNPFMFDVCGIDADEVQLAVFGGGSEPIGGLTRRDLRYASSSGIKVGGFAFGKVAQAAGAANAGGFGPGGSFSGGGGSPGSGNAGEDASNGNAGGNAGENAGGNAGGGNDGGSAGSSGKSNPPTPPVNGSTPKSDTLVEWNILPPSDGKDINHGGPIHDSGAAAAPLPLPAPVWMALAGLTLVVAFRRRLMP